MPEWLNGALSKSVGLKGSEGSNPSFSAKNKNGKKSFIINTMEKAVSEPGVKVGNLTKQHIAKL